jgi:cytochrome c551/c552
MDMNMNMKQSWFVIVVAALMLSACGNKSEVESEAANAPTPSAEQKTPSVAEQAMQPPAGRMAPEQAAPAAAQPPAPAAMEKPAKASDGTKDKPLSREEGLDLANKSGCLACHKIETKLVGPAWRDVSQRYKGDAGAKARLVEKVKKGGKGNWTAVTGGVPMPPNSPRVSDENIGKLVTFVLSL